MKFKKLLILLPITLVSCAGSEAITMITEKGEDWKSHWVTPDPGPTPGPTPGTEWYSPDNDLTRAGYNGFVKDVCFKDGFKVRKTDNSGDFTFKKNIDIYNQQLTPVWEITQWMTDYEINPETGANTYISHNEQKTADFGIAEHTISSGPDDAHHAKELTFNSKTGEFSLAALCGNEYVNGRKWSQGYGGYWWIHFLIEQSYDMSSSIKINDCESIIMDMEYSVDYDEKVGDVSGQIADCAQIEWYVTLQDQTVAWDDNNPNYMWFGVNLYDNRDVGKVDPSYMSSEYGSGVCTYRPGGNVAFDGTKTMPAAGSGKDNTRHIRFDMKQQAVSAFNSAQSKGYMAGCSLQNLIIGSMNLGFEVHTKRNVQFSVKSFNIYYK